MIQHPKEYLLAAIHERIDLCGEWSQMFSSKGNSEIDIRSDIPVSAGFQCHCIFAIDVAPPIRSLFVLQYDTQWASSILRTRSSLKDFYCFFFFQLLIRSPFERVVASLMAEDSHVGLLRGTRQAMARTAFSRKESERSDWPQEHRESSIWTPAKGLQILHSSQNPDSNLIKKLASDFCSATHWRLSGARWGH